MLKWADSLSRASFKGIFIFNGQIFRSFSWYSSGMPKLILRLSNWGSLHRWYKVCCVTLTPNSFKNSIALFTGRDISNMIFWFVVLPVSSSSVMDIWTRFIGFKVKYFLVIKCITQTQHECQHLGGQKNTNNYMLRLQLLFETEKSFCVWSTVPMLRKRFHI